jgi:hypothetical protein
MTRTDTLERAFRDELSKIAGELQGFTRIGRKPISIERMLEREAEITGIPEEFSPVVEAGDAAGKSIAKLAGKGRIGLSTLGLVGGGAGLYHVGRKAEMDRRQGRSMRIQQRLAMQQAGY